MKLYEIMYIIKPDLEGDALEEAITRVNEVMEKEGGSVTLQKKIGKRRLAYAIDDYKEGYYVLVNLQAGPPVLPALEHFFRVSEGYLRHLVIRLDEGRKKIGAADVQPEAGSDAAETATAAE